MKYKKGDRVIVNKLPACGSDRGCGYGYPPFTGPDCCKGKKGTVSRIEIDYVYVTLDERDYSKFSYVCHYHEKDLDLLKIKELL
jgi:threonine dehydrogenase-like Zn-dependent dehydrogenase